MAVAILAAGASRRMGVPKQLLNWGEVTLLGHAIESALKLNTKEVIVVLGANYKLIKNEIDHYPITILNNTNWDMGLGKSIACSVNHMMQSKDKFDGLLISLADQPLIDVEFLKTLINNFEINKNAIIATSYEKGKQGVPVIFDNIYFEELSTLYDDKGAKHLIEKYKNHTKSYIPKEKNLDLDFKEDYDKLYNANFND